MEDLMKKTLIVLLLAVAVALLVPQAQAQSVHFGLKGGLNFADATFKGTAVDMPDFKSQTGPTWGIFANFKLGPVTIQPEVLLSQRGVKYTEYEGTDALVTGHMKLDYIEVPILVKYSFLSGPIKPFIFAGPSFSYLRKAREGYDVDIVDNTDQPDYYQYTVITDSFKKTEIAGVFGIGVDCQLSKVVLSLDARYHLGLGNIADEEMLGDSDITSVKNTGISVMVGIGF
jgi:hypothetical protein